MALLVIISVIIGFLAYIRYKKISNPLTIFSILWAVIFYLYSLKLKAYFDISSLTWTVLLLQTIGFALGCFLADRVPLKIKKSHPVVGYSPKMGIIYLLCTVTLVVLLMDTVEVIKHLMSGMSYYDLANQELITENETTGLMVLVKIFIVFPMTYGISAITASQMVTGKRNRLLFLLNIVIVALYALQHGGRHIVLIFVFSYIFAYAFSNKHNMLDRKKKWLIIFMSFTAVFFAVWLSMARGIEDLGMSLYSYFSCTIPHLDQWITRLVQAGEYTYGFTSLNGFISPIVILLKGIGIITGAPDIYQMANTNISAVEDVTSIGYGVSTNAFVGLGYSFYADGGLLFVLFGTIIYGYITMMSYNKMNQTRDPKHIATYLILICTVCMSFVRFQLCQYFYAMALLMMNVVYKGERGKRE